MSLFPPFHLYTQIGMELLKTGIMFKSRAVLNLSIYSYHTQSISLQPKQIYNQQTQLFSEILTFS